MHRTELVFSFLFWTPYDQVCKVVLDKSNCSTTQRQKATYMLNVLWWLETEFEDLFLMGLATIYHIFLPPVMEHQFWISMKLFHCVCSAFCFVCIRFIIPFQLRWHRNGSATAVWRGQHRKCHQASLARGVPDSCFVLLFGLPRSMWSWTLGFCSGSLWELCASVFAIENRAVL